ncbi:MAG: undecaprenyl-phosphate glucose phosphotransferase [uncultured bacterium]|nr:MAG: undecaprenyl-phosphate glucose phosphotransferase [uncultured bacterium]
MKRFELTFAFIQLPLDYLMLILAGFSAYGLRFTKVVTAIRPILFNLAWNKYWPLVLVVATGWIVIFALTGLYSANPNRKLAKELGRVFLACSTGFAAITIYVFFTLAKFDSRFLVLAGAILAIIYVSIARTVLRLIKILCYRLGVGLRRTVIIGTQSVADQIQQSLESQPQLGYKVVGLLKSFNQEELDKLLIDGLDEIIFADPKSKEDEALQTIDFANENHITFKYSADLFATISSNMAISTIAGIPIIELRRTRLHGWGNISKRIGDIVGSLFFMLLFSPLFLLSAIIILIETGRPIIYKNERVGQEGKKFFTYKFRSMYQKYCTGDQFGKAGQEAIEIEQELIKEKSTKQGPVYKIKNDPRITPFGRFIRSLSLDELPQFFNVLIGNMSLVGPRPHQPREVNKYEKWHKTVLAIKPGITGLAQISGRSDLSFDEEARLDIFYIEHWSFFIDFVILIKTPFIVIKKTGSIV